MLDWRKTANPTESTSKHKDMLWEHSIPWGRNTHYWKYDLEILGNHLLVHVYTPCLDVTDL